MAGLIDYSIIQPGLANALIEQSKTRQMQQAAQERQNALVDLQLRAAQRGEEEALAERELAKGATSFQDLAQRYQQAGMTKQALAAQKSFQEQRANTLKIATDTNKFIQDQLRGVIALGTRESANQALDRAERMGLDVSLERAQLEQIPDSEIKRWAFTQSEGAAKALEQTIIQFPGGGTGIEPKYAISGAQARTDLRYVPGTPAEVSTMPYIPGTPAERMPLGVPGQTPPTRAAGMNALALPAPGVGPMAQGAMPTPTGGRYFPPAMTPQQQAAEARAQQQLGMERERLELSKEEAQRKRAEVPSETRKELTSIDKQRSIIEGGLNAVKNNPSAFGFVRGAVASALPYGESLMGRIETPEQTQARAYVYNVVSGVIHERAGTAQSAHEMKRLRSFLPADTDNAEQITNKLKGFQEYLQDLEKGTIKAAPPAAKKALEETRKPQLSARDQQALEWANANAGDPRAAQIKQRLGVQ